MDFYADDTIINCCGSTPVKAIEPLQKAFVVIQHSLHKLKLVLTADKPKFSNSRERPQIFPLVITLKGNEIELVHKYKYLGVLIEHSLTFKQHTEKLVKKLRIKLGFYF